MNGLRERLTKVAKKIKLVDAALVFARGRVKRWNELTHKARDTQEEAQDKADAYRRDDELGRARKQDRRARRAGARASKRRDKRQKWIGRARELAREKHDLKERKEDLQRQLDKLKPRIDGNKIVGGDSHEERLQFALTVARARCANGERRNFYSQPGAFSPAFLIQGEPSGYRSDCSQFGHSVTWACDLEAFDGWGYRGGYTGSYESGMEPCSVEYAMNHPMCAILYGPPGRTFHVEWSDGDGTQNTTGHGDARINRGTFNLFGSGYRCFKPRELTPN
jgi:hypothetical protein